MLAPHRQELTGQLWTVVQSAEPSGDRRLRAAALSRLSIPTGPIVRRIAPDVASFLLGENPLLVNEWVGMLRPVGRSLVDPLADVTAGLNDLGPRRLATSILAGYASADAEQLVDLMVNADPAIHGLLARGHAAPRGRDPFAIGQLSRPEPERPQASRIGPSEKSADTLARHRATTAVALLRLGKPDAVWPLLAFSSIRACNRRRFIR